MISDMSISFLENVIILSVVRIYRGKEVIVAYSRVGN